MATTSVLANAEQEPASQATDLGALRAEMQAGFEKILAELGRQQDALADVRMVVGKPGERPERAAPNQQSEAHQSQSPDGPLEVADSQPAAGTRPAAGAQGGEAGMNSQSTDNKSLKSSRTGTRGGGKQEWKEALDLDQQQSYSMAFTRFTWLQHRMRAFFRHHEFKFDCFFGLVLLASSVVTGIEIQNSLDGVDSPWLEALEHVFLLLFVIELVARLLGNGARSGMQYLWSGWFFFDATLVAVGVIGSWIVKPILLSMDGNKDAVDGMRKLVILRVFRLLRLARALRLLELFEEVWKLSNGIVTSFRTVVSACLMILMTIYIFSCLGVEFIVGSSKLQADENARMIVQSHFSSLPRTMLTLLAFTNADSIAGIYEPMVIAHPVIAPFFACLWLFVTVSLMNLVTAVIVDTAIRQSEADRDIKLGELRKKAMKLMPEVQELFERLENTGDGTLEWRDLSLEGVQLSDDLRIVLDEGKLMDLFEFIDVDESGSVDKSEFVDGVMHLAMQDVPVETTQVLQLLRSNQKALDSVKVDIQNIQANMGTRMCPAAN